MHRIVTEPNVRAEYQGTTSRIFFTPANNVYEYSRHSKNAYTSVQPALGAEAVRYA